MPPGVQIFRSTETMGLVSVLSALFDTTQLLDNARQQRSFSVAIYASFMANMALQWEVLDLLLKCMSFEQSVICYYRMQREYVIQHNIGGSACM